MATPPPPRPMNPIEGTTINPLEPPPNVLAHDESTSTAKPTVVQRLANSLNPLHPRKKSKSLRHKLLFGLQKDPSRSQGSDESSSGEDEDDDNEDDNALAFGDMSKSTPHPSSSTTPRPFEDTVRQRIKPAYHSMAQSQANFRRPPMDGSLRQGTQSLIQALQAIPWDQDDDTALTPPVETVEDSEEEPEFPMYSSIHTIHRSRGASRGARTAQSNSLADYFTHNSAQDEQDNPPEPDFDVPLSESESPSAMSPSVSILSKESNKARSIKGSIGGSRIKFDRQGSVATVRVQRRTQLAGKLREVFGVDDITEVVAELPCWLLRSVLLQGYMYLTNSHLCFFAHMPSREDQVLKSGSLSKKASRTRRWNKHWFILKNDVLSWYNSSTDPYFPHGNIDLRYAISCDVVDEKTFKLRTNTKTITLAADSMASREEWVKSLRKIIFKAQNMGESVKIAIPYSVILDVDRSTAMDFSDTIEVKVVDRDEQMTMDSYFFAYFHDLDTAMEQIREAVRTHRQAAVPSGQEERQSEEGDVPNPFRLPSSDTVTDTTLQRSPSAKSKRPNASTVSEESGPTGRAASSPLDPQHGGLKLTSLLRPFSMDGASPAGLFRRTSAKSVPVITETPSILHDDAQADQPAVLTNSPPAMNTSFHSQASMSESLTPSITSLQPPLPRSQSSSSDHTYPPSTSTESTPNHSQRSSWAVGVPGWLKAPSRRLLGSLPSVTQVSVPPGKPDASLTEVLEAGRAASESGSARPSLEEETDGEYHGGHGAMGFSILEAPKDVVGKASHVPDQAVVDKFREYFALDEREQLVGYLSGSLFRVLPVTGRLYISTNYFCFRSSQPLIKTRMMIPIRDILSTEKQKAFRFGHHGLIVIIKGHEELFFEFSSVDRRNSTMELLERQMSEVRAKQQSSATDTAQLTQGQREALILEELDSSSLDDTNVPIPESANDSLPAVMFTSTSSTFLSFKPRESLRFTCLTIGSRGDVQPYIALCKALQADGHKVRIATHLEFKDWIEGHGIEYGYVGGDPAELMRICIENGTFTVSFLKEGLMKFRGWLDDLLVTSWKACEGSDVLIESPSAMAGIHIAEALKIPYFRAFTMPWTRTRAYPHAFAVPEHKMGGGYNYMTYVMFDQVFWRAISGQINRWRRNTLGIESTNFDKLEQHKVPFLYNFSPSIVPPPLDWYEWIRVTGYWFLNDADDSAAKKWTPPEGLLPFIDNAHAQSKKVVYIGFGSIVVSDPDAMTRCVVDAVVQSGVYAILSKGWSDRLSTKKDGEDQLPTPPLPPQIFSLKSVPHDWLFPRIDAACHHGGAGTTGASLRAGIPTIIKPFFGDQFFWSDRVEALGIGSGVRKLSVETLTAALVAATTDQKQIDRAKLVGESIRAENGVANAIEAIYRDLEYARSLIKHPSPEENETPVRLGRSNTTKSTESSMTKEGEGEPSRSRSSMDASISASGGVSDDWSVISGEDGRRSTSKSRDVSRPVSGEGYMRPSIAEDEEESRDEFSPMERKQSVESQGSSSTADVTPSPGTSAKSSSRASATFSVLTGALNPLRRATSLKSAVSGASGAGATGS